MLLNEEEKEEYCQDISEDYDFLRADHYDSIKVQRTYPVRILYAHVTARNDCMTELIVILNLI